MFGYPPYPKGADASYGHPGARKSLSKEMACPLVTFPPKEMYEAAKSHETFCRSMDYL